MALLRQPTYYRIPQLRDSWSRESFTWTRPLPLLLLGKDKQFAAAGEFKTYDYPNPRGKPFPIDGLTWTATLVPELIGKDQFFDSPGLGPNSDWPNPRGPRHNDIFNWTAPTNPNLPAAAPPKPFKQTEWPNPLGPGFPLENRTFLDGVDVQLIGKDQFFSAPGVGPQYDYPNPRGATYPIGTRTWTLSTNPSLYLKPFAQTDWPNPRGAAFPLENRTFLDAVDVQLVGKDQFFSAPGMGPDYDWPNPIGPRHGIDLYGFTGALNPNLTIVIPATPFAQRQHPNPTRATNRVQDWTWSTNPNLYRSGKPFKLDDYPNPLIPRRKPDLSNFLLPYNSTFFPSFVQFISDTPTIANIIGVHNSAFLLLAAASTRIGPSGPFTETGLLAAQSTREIVNNSGTKLVIFTANDKTVGE